MELHDLGVLDLIDSGPFKSKVSHNQMCDFLKYAVQEQDYKFPYIHCIKALMLFFSLWK